MKANLKGVTEATGLNEVVPAGQYKAVCTDYREDINKKDSTPLIELDWSLVGGEHEGHLVTDALFFTPKGIRRVKACLKRLAIKKNLDEDIELEKSDFFGLTATITLEVETFTRKDGTPGSKNRVTFLGYNEEEASPKGGNGQAGPGITPPPAGAGANKSAAAAGKPEDEAPF